MRENWRQRVREAAGVLLLAAALVPPAGGAWAGEGGFPGQTALVVFVSYEGSLPLPVHPGRLRLMATDAMTEILQERGYAVFTYPDIQDQMRQWSVRSDRNISAEFLDAVHGGGAGLLAVARLILYHDRMILLARVLSADTGRLVWAGVEENESITGVTDGPDARSWESALNETCRRLLAGWRHDHVPDEVGDPLVVLPADAEGVEPAPTDTAMHCLLGALLAGGRWSVPDPSVVAAALWKAGHSPSGVDAESRSWLASEFGTRMLLVPRLVSFERSLDHTTAALDEEDRPSIALDKDMRTPFHLSVAAVECSSGEVLFAAHRYVEPENPEGIFGIVRSIRLSRRLQKGADEIVRELHRRDGGR